MIDVADTAVTRVSVQHSGSFDGPFDGTAMAPSRVGYTGRVFTRSIGKRGEIIRKSFEN